MADDTTNAPAGTEPQAGSSDATENTGTPASEHMIPKSRFDEVNKRLKELEAAHGKATREREEAERKRLEDDQKWKDLYENERKARSDSEAQIAAVLEERRQDKIRGGVRSAAQAAGFVNPDDAYGFLDQAALVVDDAGNVSNARALVEALAKSKPYLLGGGKPTPGVQPGPRPARTTPLTMAEVRNMSRDEIVKNWDAVQEAQRQ